MVDGDHDPFDFGVGEGLETVPVHSVSRQAKSSEGEQCQYGTYDSCSRPLAERSSGERPMLATMVAESLRLSDNAPLMTRMEQKAKR